MGEVSLLGTQNNHVLRLAVCLHQSHRQVCCTLWAPEPLFLVVPVSHTYPHHYVIVHCIQVHTGRTTGLNNHPNCIANVSPDTQLS